MFHWDNGEKKLSADKIEFLFIGTQKQRDKIKGFFLPLSYARKLHKKVPAQTLGIIFDNNWINKTVGLLKQSHRVQFGAFWFFLYYPQWILRRQINTS